MLGGWKAWMQWHYLAFQYPDFQALWLSSLLARFVFS